MKKSISLLLAIGLILSLFAGCTKQESAPAPSATISPSEVKGEPVVISMVAKDMSPDDPTSAKFMELLSKGLQEDGKNIKMKLIPVQTGTYSEKLGLLLQSGEIPDIIFFQGGDLQFGITQKILEDLNPYVNKSTYVKAMMEPYNVERLKNYPYLLYLSPATYKVPVIRKDWFGKLDSGKALLADPSIDNYYAFFKEIKEKLTSKAAYTVPGDLAEINNVFDQAFGLTKTWLKGSDGKYAYSRTTEGEKKKLEFYAKLYKEGLLDNEYLTKKWDTKEKAFYDGQVGVISGTQGAVINIYNNKQIGQNGAGAEVMTLPPAKGVAQGYTPVDTSKESRGYAISAISKNKDLAFSVLEYAVSPKGQMLCKLGFEGVHYTIANNKIKLTDKASEWYAKFSESVKTFKPSIPFDESTPYFTKPAYESLDMFSKYATLDNDFLIPDEFITKWDACGKAYNEFCADVVTGKKPIGEFDNFVKQWNAVGGKEVTDYANKKVK